MSSRNMKKKVSAYVLYWESGIPVAVVEAKGNKYIVSRGLQQALELTWIEAHASNLQL